MGAGEILPYLWDMFLYLWYLLLFPVVSLFCKSARPVTVIYSLLMVLNVYILDVMGVADDVWFLTQAKFDLLFIAASFLIKDKNLMLAAIVICSNSLFINIIEHLSEKQSVFYNMWESLNLLTIDLLALCLITYNKRANKIITEKF